MATMATMTTLPAPTRLFLVQNSSLLFPRASPLLRRRVPLRHASATAKPPKAAPILSQPDKYRPPSHGRAVPRSVTDQRSYGPKLTEEDKKRMASKKYPNMMAPEGSFMYKFLHAKWLHVCITLVQPPIPFQNSQKNMIEK